VLSGATRVTDEMFFAAARTLAGAVSTRDLESGCLFPPLRSIREVSASIATAVARVAYDRGLATRPRPGDLKSWVDARMYQPAYVREGETSPARDEAEAEMIETTSRR
jgi:malate dehydrogenase (oxaloacetate-decarboxylating)(NADP+)